MKVLKIAALIIAIAVGVVFLFGTVTRPPAVPSCEEEGTSDVSWPPEWKIIPEVHL